MVKPLNIVGSSTEVARRERDFYPTPPEVTQALIDYLKIPKDKIIWECAAGSGAMSDIFKKNGYHVITTDIQDGQDFLTHTEQCDWIITNPPFNVADDFIRRANDLSVKFAFLLKCQYWHSKRRLSIFADIQPSDVLPLTWRPNFTGQGGSVMDCIWCVWNGQADFTRFQPLAKPQNY